MDKYQALTFVLVCSFLPVLALADRSTIMVQPFRDVDAVPVCTSGHVCQAKSESSSCDLQWCYCDDVCDYFGDCCYDYEQTASTPGPPMRNASGAGLIPDPDGSGDGQDGESGGDGESGSLGEYVRAMGIPRSYLQCIDVGQPFSDPLFRYGFWLNTKCPVNASVNGRRLCEDPSGNDVILKNPVFGARGVAYKNVYCAVCNGEDLSSLKAWAIDVYCDSGSASEFDFQDPDAACRLVFSSRTSVGVRYCFPDVVADCGGHGGSPGLCEACDLYAAVAIEPEPEGLDGFIPEPPRVFRNPHCALSHGVNFTSGDIARSCGLCPSNSHTVLPMIPSLSILINFGTGTTQVDDEVLPSRCPPDFVFDPFTDRCRLLSCAEGYRLENGRCIAHELPEKEDDSNQPSTVDFLIEINIDGMDNCSYAGEIGSCFANTVLQILDGMSTQSFNLPDNGGATEPTCLHKGTNTTTFEITLPKELIPLDARSLYILEKELDVVLNRSRYGLRECLSFSNENDTELRSIVLVGCHPDTCDIRDTGKCGNTDGKITEMFPARSNISHGFVRVDNSWYSEEQTVFIVTYVWQPVDENFEKLSMRVRLCDGEELSCAHVALNASLFQPVIGPEGSSLEYLPTGNVLPPGNFSILRNDSVLVCSFFDTAARQGTRYDTAQLYITLIGTSLSVISTAVIFVTYLAFRSLRNHIRCPLLNLTASLTLANLLFLMSRLATVNDVACTAVAFLGHMLWLSVSMWSNIIALGMYGAFAASAVSLRDHSVSRTKLVYTYMYAYGVPLAICIPCLALDLTYQSRDVPLFRYRNGEVCFIFAPDQMLYAFVVPLLACVLINLVLFALTVRGIRNTKKKAQIVKGKTPVARQAMEELPIYLKISSLMGFSWLIGFLATLTGSLVLTYIFVVSNSCQGLLISLCFANGRVRALWMAKLRALFCACCTGGVWEPKRADAAVATVSERYATTGTSRDHNIGEGSAAGRAEDTAL